MVLFVVLSSCLCCCCLDPVLALEAKLCFFVGVRLCSSGCWVTFRLARDVDCMAGGGLGLCTVLVAQKTNEYFCSSEKRKLLKALFCHWNVRVLFFWNFMWSKFAKNPIFKNLELQVPWGLRKCFLFDLSLWRHITRLPPVAYFKKISSSNLILCVQWTCCNEW